MFTKKCPRKPTCFNRGMNWGRLHSKHKYAFVLGKNKKETIALRKLFEENNKLFPYSKERGK